MKNNKGFTLVELLAALVILSIIMLVAVPSTLNVFDKSKKQQYIADAKKMITLAESTMRSNTNINYPISNRIVILYLSVLNDGTIDEDPEGNEYSNTESFVAVTYKATGNGNYKYEFHTQLVGSKGNKNRGVVLSDSDDLIGDERYNKIQSNIATLNCSQISNKIFGNTSGVCTEYR